MAWFWLNIPLCAVIFALVVGVPLWMVIRHPDAGTVAAEADRGAGEGASVRAATAASAGVTRAEAEPAAATAGVSHRSTDVRTVPLPQQ
jgi:hypothetical protein